MTTICVNCKHHSKEGDHEIWGHLCTHPKAERQKSINPVTGKYDYVERNENGDIVFIYEQFPDCQTINHGNCPHYESNQ